MGSAQPTRAPDPGVAQLAAARAPREEISGDGVRFPVGQLVGAIGNPVADFWPSNTALTHLNMGVVGDLGTGKTQLLKALISQLRAEGTEQQSTPISFLIFDYKKDFRDENFLRRVGGQVHVPYNIPLNVLALNGRTPWQRSKSFIDILSKIYGGIGPVQKDRLAHAILNQFNKQDEPLLPDVLNEYLAMSEGKADAVTAILSNFVHGQIFSTKRSELKTFEQLISDNVLIIGLSEFGADQDSKNAIVALFLDLYYEYMLERSKWPFQGRDPQLRRLNSYLLIDEASNIMKYNFAALQEILVQGREFGVGVILSSQYLSHFKTGGYDYTQPLRTWFIHRVPALDFKELKSLGITQATEQTTQRINEQELHQCFYRSLGVEGSFIRATPYYELQ